MKKWSSILFLLAVGGVFCFPIRANSSSYSTIKVQIDGLKEAKGQICYSLFSRSKGFPDSEDDKFQAECIPIQAPIPMLTIENLDSGTYALAFFHDANEDGKLNRNFLGIPQEGFGFSQDPEVTTSPPSFGESAVLVIGAETNLQVQMRYF